VSCWCLSSAGIKGNLPERVEARTQPQGKFDVRVTRPGPRIARHPIDVTNRLNRAMWGMLGGRSDPQAERRPAHSTRRHPSSPGLRVETPSTR
jgi:hypothetical protein